MIEVGGINLVQSTVDLEYRLLVLEKLFDKIVPSASISNADIESARVWAIETLNTKYPLLGIKKK